jgi:ankyrin repeat protein
MKDFEKHLNYDVRTQGGSSYMHLAVTKGDSEAVKVLCQRKGGSEINLQNQDGADLTLRDHGGQTALHWAVQIYSLQVVKLLLERGANANAQDETGRTPLHFAVKRDNSDIVKLLLEFNSDKNIQNKEGLMALDLIAEKSDPVILQFLET